MSTCISEHGEYSSHQLDGLHTCTFCGVLDEDALRAELESARRELAFALEQRDEAREKAKRLESDAAAFQREVDAVQEAVGSEMLGDIPGMFRALQNSVAVLKHEIDLAQPAVTYRLPGWLGGHKVFSPSEVGEDGCRQVDFVLPEGSPGTLRVPAEYLVEVRPLSIDDPVTLPLETAPDGDGDRLVIEAAPLGLLVADHRGGVAVVHGDDLLNLARAAWRRWHEVNGGAR